MSTTSAATGLIKQNYDSQFYIDFVRKNRYAPYTGTNPLSPIVLREDLTKVKGDSITLALVNQLSGAGVTGSTSLEGSEEALKSRSMKIIVDQFRNGVSVPMLQEQFSSIDLMDAAKEDLLNWRLDYHKDAVDAALKSINGVVYASASEANRDAWIVDNQDRVAFGDILATTGPVTDHSAGLGAIAAAEKISASNVSKLKRQAQRASPIIRPWKIQELDEEFFLGFATLDLMRDLRADTTISQANREARPREVMSNPIFKGGSLIYDGIILLEIPEQTTIGTVGTCSAKVDPFYLLGATALCYAVAKRPQFVFQDFDYGDKNGVGIREVSTVAKVRFGTGSADTDDTKDHGVARGYYGAASDS